MNTKDSNAQRYEQEVEYLNAYIEQYYRNILPVERVDIQSYLEYSHVGVGKRYRGVLSLVFGLYFGLSREEMLPFATAIEMIHTYSLIHDDLPALDNDTIRRGKEAHHVRFGEAVAILSGDALLTDAFYAMTLTQGDSERILKAIREVAQGCGSQGMVLGQILDILGEEHSSCEVIHKLKTGAMMRCSCTVPAILAGVEHDTYNDVAEFGLLFGILFQVIDDILDEVGNTNMLGKTVGKDKVALKQTFIAMYGLDGAYKKAYSYKQDLDDILNRLVKRRREHSNTQEYALNLITYIVETICSKVDIL